MAAQRLESSVLLDAANHYANTVVGVTADAEGRAAVRTLARGYALRVAEEQTGVAPSPSADLGARVRALAAGGCPWTDAVVTATDEADRPGRPPEGVEPRRWRHATRWARALGLADAPAVADRVDYAGALRYGYLLRCAEAALPTGHRRIDLDDLLGIVDRLLAAGDALFVGEVTKVALVLGVLHGLELEAGSEPAREAAVAAARAGFALRRAEEDAGVARGASPPLSAWLRRARRTRADLALWDAMQVAAWEAIEPVRTSGADRDGDPPPQLTVLPGHPDRGAAFAELANAVGIDVGAVLGGLPPGEIVRAVRFGYLLRIVEASLPAPMR